MATFDRLLKPFGARTRVTMVKSVGQFVAGETYKLPAETADQWIARGYCDGELSREYADEDLATLRGNPQVVSLGG